LWAHVAEHHASNTYTSCPKEPDAPPAEHVGTRRISKTTTNHEEIRRWVEERGGLPAAVKNTLSGDAAGVLYFNFPGADKKDVNESS
jgi:hypothetical protein